jgi:hypothetical protein
MMLPRVSPTNPSPTRSSTAPLAGTRLEELKSAEELFALAGQKAVVFKYSGGDVQFWVEIEFQGRKRKVELGPQLWGADKQPRPDQTLEGYFVWVRSEANDAGKEEWTIACRTDAITTQASGVQLSTPVADIKTAQSEVQKQSVGSSARGLSVQVWKGQVEKGKNLGVAMTSTLTMSSIPSPLPTDQEVCLQEIREERKQPKSALAAAAASTIALLASPQVGLFLAASVLTPGRMDETIDAHVIRVMCKAASKQAK